jgi:hypothetical protein
VGPTFRIGRGKVLLLASKLAQSTFISKTHSFQNWISFPGKINVISLLPKKGTEVFMTHTKFCEHFVSIFIKTVDDFSVRNMMSHTYSCVAFYRTAISPRHRFRLGSGEPT